MKGPYECFCTLNDSCTKLIRRDESGRQFGGNSGNGGKVGQKRANFFLALVAVSLLHQFFRSKSRLPALATATRFSQTPDTRRFAGSRESRVTRLDTPGREESCQCGRSYFFHEFCAGHRTRILAVFVVCWAYRLWAANSLAWGLFHSLIPCRGSHGLKMTVRSQYCLLIFGHGLIISLFSML